MGLNHIDFKVENLKEMLKTEKAKNELASIEKDIADAKKEIASLELFKQESLTMGESYWLSLGYWISLIRNAEISFKVVNSTKIISVKFIETNSNSSKYAVIYDRYSPNDVKKAKNYSINDIRNLIESKKEDNEVIKNVKKEINEIFVAFIQTKMNELINCDVKLMDCVMKIETPHGYSGETQWEIAFTHRY